MYDALSTRAPSKNGNPGNAFYPLDELDEKVLAMSLGPHDPWVDEYLAKMHRRKKDDDSE